MHKKGPLLLACNHPNSFFDAVLLGAYFRQPVHFLARGDAFKNPLVKKILIALKAIPIYRLSEGKEHLALNDYTFECCIEILTNGGIVLIFSEGLCLNKWQLRTLKKGTARMALNGWKQNPDTYSFPVLPVSFNYSSFTNFRKAVIIHFGEPIFYNDIPERKNEAEQIVLFNKLLYARLERGILLEKDEPEIIRFLLLNFRMISKDKHDLVDLLKEKQALLLNLHQETFFDKLKKAKKLVLNNTDFFLNLICIVLASIPALMGFIIHLPAYYPLNNFIKKKTHGTVFYHSVLFGVLIIIYPLFVLLVSITLTIILKKILFLLLIPIIPLLALIYLKWKDCVESVINYSRFSKQEIRQLKQVLQS